MLEKVGLKGGEEDRVRRDFETTVHTRTQSRKQEPHRERDLLRRRSLGHGKRKWRKSTTILNLHTGGFKSTTVPLLQLSTPETPHVRHSLRGNLLLNPGIFSGVRRKLSEPEDGRRYTSVSRGGETYSVPVPRQNLHLSS